VPFRDDVVLELNRRKVHQEPYGIPQWLDLVGHEIGAARAKSEYDAMVAGATLRRADQQIEVTYVPRGAEVAGYGWVRNRAAGEQTCKFQG
jgi:hypothetical protein